MVVPSLYFGGRRGQKPSVLFLPFCLLFSLHYSQRATIRRASMRISPSPWSLAQQRAHLVGLGWVAASLGQALDRGD